MSKETNSPAFLKVLDLVPNGYKPELSEMTLRDGETKMSNITPFRIVEGRAFDGTEVPPRTLYLNYIDVKGDVGTVDINSLPGLAVIDDPEHGLLIEFQYLSSKDQELETKKRRIIPSSIHFGIQGNLRALGGSRNEGHMALSENADFYITGRDIQYDPEKDSGRGIRRFPFWRMGVYGPQVDQKRIFLPIENASSIKKIN